MCKVEFTQDRIRYLSTPCIDVHLFCAHGDQADCWFVLPQSEKGLKAHRWRPYISKVSVIAQSRKLELASPETRAHIF